MARINFSFKEHFQLSPNEQKGYFAFLLLLIIIVGVKCYITSRSTAPLLDQKLILKTDSIRNGLAKNQAFTRLKLEFFDPNAVTAIQLINYGFSEKTAKRIVKFRNAGGRFYNTSDLFKIYGIDSAHIEKILPFVRIPSNKKTKHHYKSKSKIKRSIVNINSADSLELISVYGIGHVLSSRIIKFRKLLGGFYSVEQLLEVYGIRPETYLELRKQLSCSGSVRKININTCTFKRLVKHPYCTYEMCKIIFNARKSQNEFASQQDLKKLHGLDWDKLLKLLPYLKFD